MIFALKLEVRGGDGKGGVGRGGEGGLILAPLPCQKKWAHEKYQGIAHKFKTHTISQGDEWLKNWRCVSFLKLLELEGDQGSRIPCFIFVASDTSSPGPRTQKNIQVPVTNYT